MNSPSPVLGPALRPKSRWLTVVFWVSLAAFVIGAYVRVTAKSNVGAGGQRQAPIQYRST